MIANVRISGAQSFPYSESDIRVNLNDPRKIIAAANANVTAGGTGQGQFFSSDGGANWGQTNLSLNSGDLFQSDPCVDWTSDGTAWAITIGFDALRRIYGCVASNRRMAARAGPTTLMHPATRRASTRR